MRIDQVVIHTLAQSSFEVQPYVTKDGRYASNCPLCGEVVTCYLKARIPESLCDHMNSEHPCAVSERGH